MSIYMASGPHFAEWRSSKLYLCGFRQCCGKSKESCWNKTWINVTQTTGISIFQRGNDIKIFKSRYNDPFWFPLTSSNQIKSSLLSYWDKVRYTAITNSTHCHMSQNKNHVWLNTKYRSRITKQKCSDLTHRDMSSKHSLMNTNCYQYDNGSRKPQRAYGLQIW